jgi:hypothetical protein
MEITKVSRQGSSRVSQSLRIKYDIPSSGDGRASSMTGTILKEDNTVGFFNADNAGVVGFSLSRGHELSLHEVKMLFDTAVSDAQETFDGDSG